MIRVILTPCSCVIALGELELVTVLTRGRLESSWWWRDRRLCTATAGQA